MINRKKIGLGIAFIYISFTFGNLVNQEFRLQKYQIRLSEDMKTVVEEQNTLQSSARYYQTQMGVEEIARKRLGYYKNDEVPFRILSTDNQTIEQEEKP